MYYYLNKYLNKNCVLINQPSTYPKSWLNFLNDHKQLIRNYKYVNTFYDNKHEKLKREGKECSRVGEHNKYNDEFNRLVNEFADLINETDIYFLCFHATRLAKEEINDMKNDGLQVFDKKSLYEYKYRQLFENGYITKDELELLNNKNLLNNPNEEDRSQKIYVDIGKYNMALNEHNDNYNLYNNYGGEITYDAFENTKLGDKLRSVSKPYLIISKFQANHTMCKMIAESIMDNFNQKEISDIELGFWFEHSLTVLDVLEVDEKSKLIFKHCANC